MTIVEQLKQLIETGTETEARKFIADHFNEFPEHLQKTLAVELFKEAMVEDFETRQQIVEMKKEAIEVFEAIEAAEAEASKGNS